MPPSDAAIKAVEDWCSATFEDHVVESGTLDREVVLFRAHLNVPHSPRYELEISYEAFEDRDPQTLTRDLDFLKAAAKLRERPSVRLMYTLRRRLVETDRHS